MVPLVPILGAAVLGMTLVGLARRQVARITRMRDEQDRSLRDGDAPMLRRDPASGQWRPDPVRVEDRS